MHLSLQKLFSLLILVSPGFFSPLEQAPLQYLCSSDVNTISNNDLTRDVVYGYQGSGVYNIIGQGDSFNLALGSTGSGDGAPAVVWKANSTNSQRWVLSDFGGEYVTIANNATGVLLSANATRSETYTFFTSPGKLETRWKLVNFSTSTTAVRFFNAKYTDQVLAVFDRITGVNGTIVYDWPIQGQFNNEAWQLQYLGAQ